MDQAQESRKKLYSNVFAENFQYICDLTIKRMKVIREFLTVLGQRAECEEMYSKQMRKIGSCNFNIYEE